MALFSLGFRPFFLFGTLWSLVVVTTWVLFQSGNLDLSHLYFSPMIYHAHEMLFGFATAIIAGFVLTAAPNWTGISGIRGKKLILLFVLWVLGRLGLFFPQQSIFYMVIDLSFLPLLTYFMLPYLGIKSQRRNIFFLIVFTLLFFCNLSVHLEVFLFPESNLARRGLLGAFFLIVFIITIIGGRVIPFFTSRVIENYFPRKWPYVEKVTIGFTALVFGSIVLEIQGTLSSLILILASLFHMARFFSWQPWRTLEVPELWILHLGYFWIALGLLCMGCFPIIGLPRNLGMHIIAIGGIGGLILGMMARISLGHTARPIRVSKPLILSFILINLSVIARGIFPAFNFDNYHLGILISGLLWGLAFTIFIFGYWKILVSPRLDGKPG